MQFLQVKQEKSLKKKLIVGGRNSYFIHNQFYYCLDELVFVLYNENYFSYIENAYDYTSKIYDFIDYSLATFPRKNTPKPLSKYGDYYIFYKSNAKTTWYIFFSKKHSNYLIKHITNNHVFKASFINELNKNE